MLYSDLRYARTTFQRGDNVTTVLKEHFAVKNNSPEIMEIAYDLQSGSYVDFVKQNCSFWSEHSMLAYPILKGIPILRPESAILASALKENG